MPRQSFKNVLFLVVFCFMLSACGGFKPMDHHYNARLEKIKIGMTVQQVRAVFPSLTRVSQVGGTQVYRYTEHDMRAISFVGVMKRTVTFHFKRGRLINWSSNRNRPI